MRSVLVVIRDREVLAKRGFSERSRSYTWAITKMPCDEAKAVIAEVANAIIGEGEEGGGA